MFTTILLLPLIMFIFLFLFSELRPKLLLIAALPGYVYNLLVVTYLLITSIFLNYSGKFIYVYQFFNWSTFEGVDSGLTIWLDYVSVIMSFTVILVASMVNIFSIYYMSNDPFIVRFFAYLSLFTFCMLLLVTASDLIQFFIGWELVGLCSYLLINFWYTRKQANIAALKAVLVNRVGDFAFMYAIALLYTTFNSLNIYEISWMVTLNSLETLNTKIIVILLFIAVMSKSAQFGLHSWLPDAMEGPTPVSALIHAATMVTAGIFLMLRLSNIFIANEEILSLVSVVGAFTAFFGATTGAAQTDIKKIIAFSTCSQLGYMVAACGMGNFAVAFFHLVTHAFFKSLLFLCAGIVIHTLGGEQDIRKMGGLLRVLPTAFISMAIAGFALSGVPFFAGFYSKEMIISIAYLKAVFENSWIAFFVFMLLLKAAIFTSMYSAKLMYYIFVKETSARAKTVKELHTDGQDFLTTQLPLMVLSLFSIFGGLLFKDALVGPGYNITLNTFSEFVSGANLNTFMEYLPTKIKLLLTLVSFSGYIYYFILKVNKIDIISLAATVINSLFGKLNIKCKINFIKIKVEIYSFFYNRWYFDAIVSYFVNSLILVAVEDLNIYTLQNKLVDGLTVAIVTGTVNNISNILKGNSQTVFAYIKNTYLAIILTILFALSAQDIYAYVSV